MAELKTKQNDASVDAFIATIENDKRRADTEAACQLVSELTGWQAHMWGKSIIGFGAYEYTYKSGRVGRWQIVGLSPRKTSLTIYIMPGFEPFHDLMDKLGKYKTGKSCLYVNRLEDIDIDVLKELILRSVAIMKDRYSWSEA